MMPFYLNALFAIAAIFALGMTAITVDRLYRRFARQHPQLGPFRENDGKCGCCAAKAACERQSGNG